MADFRDLTSSTIDDCLALGISIHAVLLAMTLLDRQAKAVNEKGVL